MSSKHAAWLLVFIVIGALSGIAFGWFFSDYNHYTAWLGEFFLNALKMIIIPLIIVAIISGIGSLGDFRKVGRLGTVTLAYYMSTTSIAVITGLLLVNWIQPGSSIQLGTIEDIPQHILDKQETGVTDLILSLISPNLFASATEMEILPIMVFAILFALALTTLGQRAEPVFTVMDGLNEAMMKLVGWIMYLAPIGIFSLVADRLAQAGGGETFLGELKAVGMYVGTVILGLGMHAITLFILMVLISRRGLSYVAGLSRALMTAFGTASSTATLPLTMACVRSEKVDDRAVKFVVPLGSTVNMDGTALYEAVAAMFIAQAYGIELSVMQQGIIFITAVLVSVGAAGIPEAGLVMIVIVLSAVGLPLEGIALLLAVDWFLDRFRTTVNVWSDCVGAAIVERIAIKKGAV